ncbi:MAG: hypothetical protein WDN26_10090 [Chitinophagaceae bacterium]
MNNTVTIYTEHRKELSQGYKHTTNNRMERRTRMTQIEKGLAQIFFKPYFIRVNLSYPCHPCSKKL